LGKLLLRRRRQLQLSRAEAAVRMSIDERRVSSWERDQEPTVSHYPAIIAFLGQEPWDAPETLPEKLFVARRRRGLTIEVAARIVGVETSTWWRWERGRKPPTFLRATIVELSFGGAQSVAA
jgi:transcriptional regulator with XRE-family HTH domain